jgi:membrane protein
VVRAGRKWTSAPRQVLFSFREHECFFMAAGISFYFMLSLVPMLFLLLAILGFFLQGSLTVQEGLREAVRVYIPFLTDDVLRNIEHVVEKPTLLGWIGGIALLLSADLVFMAVQSSLDKIFAPGRSSFLRSKMLSVLLAVLVCCGVIVTIFVNAVDQSLGSIQTGSGALSGLGALTGVSVGLHLSPWIVAALLVAWFTLAVKLLPHKVIRFRYALAGGLLGGLLWVGGRTYYVWYLENVSRLGPLFGSLGAVVLTLIWVYVSSLAFLLGAELTRWLMLTATQDGPPPPPPS